MSLNGIDPSRIRRCVQRVQLTFCYSVGGRETHADAARSFPGRVVGGSGSQRARSYIFGARSTSGHRRLCRLPVCLTRIAPSLPDDQFDSNKVGSNIQQCWTHSPDGVSIVTAMQAVGREASPLSKSDNHPYNLAEPHSANHSRSAPNSYLTDLPRDVVRSYAWAHLPGHVRCSAPRMDDVTSIDGQIWSPADETSPAAVMAVPHRLSTYGDLPPVPPAKACDSYPWHPRQRCRPVSKTSRRRVGYIDPRRKADL